MKIAQNLILYTNLFIATGLAATFTACSTREMSVLIEDKTQGQNGSFEHSKDGVPYNWQLYTQQTVPSGTFSILLDTTTFKDGRQSLLLAIHDCDSAGGWRSPGIAKQIPAKPGESYTISFWIKNTGATCKAKISGISATSGESELVLTTNELISEWKYVEHSYTIPKKMNAIRFEFNVLQPGSVWIDDVRIEKR